MLEGWTLWTITKHLQKKLGTKYARMLWNIFNKSRKQHPTKQQLTAIYFRSQNHPSKRTRHVGHCWGSKDGRISDVLLWSPTLRHASVGRQATSYLHQLCVDTECSLGNIPEVIDNLDGRRERERERERESGKSILSVCLDVDDFKDFFFLNGWL